MQNLEEMTALQSLSERVEWLLQNVTRPDGSQYSLQEPAEATEWLGHRVTSTGIWKIRHGETKNPGYLAVKALARFFDVWVTALVGDELEDEQL